MNQQRTHASPLLHADHGSQQLFTDTILRVQVHHARAKEERHLGKIPIAHYAKACALLDNFPLPPSGRACVTLSSPPYTSSSPSSSLTPQQIDLITSLRQDNWAALAEACLEAKDWVQAEAALSRLATLQEQVAGPEFQPRGKNKKKSHPKQHSPAQGASQPIHSTDSTVTASPSATGETVSTPPPSPPPRLTAEQYKVAKELVTTLGKLQSVAELLGKKQLATNIGTRLEKFQARLAREDEQV
ncbi:hypothetical protein BGZ73_006525 [Actinomortierella ambigua]|nr:hypothetical protein BGZ73_006525 [Actinomortierella ambigua]